MKSFCPNFASGVNSSDLPAKFETLDSPVRQRNISSKRVFNASMAEELNLMLAFTPLALIFVSEVIRLVEKADEKKKSRKKAKELLLHSVLLYKNHAQFLPENFKSINQVGAITPDTKAYNKLKYGQCHSFSVTTRLFKRLGNNLLTVYKPLVDYSHQSLIYFTNQLSEEAFSARFGLSRTKALAILVCAGALYMGGFYLWRSQFLALIGKKFMKSFSSKCIRKFVAENPDQVKIITKKLRINKPVMIVVGILGFAFCVSFHRTGPIHVAPTGSRFTHPIPFASELDTCYQQALIYLQGKIEEIRARLLKELEIDNEVLSPFWPTDLDLIELGLMSPEHEIIGFWCNCKGAVATVINACSPAASL